MNLRRVLIGLIAFSIAFGAVEAAVVVYLRTLEEPIRQRLLADKPHDAIFPLLTLDAWSDAGMDHRRIIVTELWREVATMVMLAATALVYARNQREWFAGFVLNFGIWDIFYYVFLQLFIDWPGSLWTWDLLFLLPVPWVGQVITPVIIAVGMVATGVAILWREAGGRPVRLGPWEWAALLIGAVVLIVAFCWRWRETVAGALPASFNWPLYGVGLAICGLALARIFTGGGRRQAERAAG